MEKPTAKQAAPIQLVAESVQKLIGLHRQLLDVVRMEREALVSAAIKGIQEATLAKQGLVEAIRQAETERLKRVGELALLWRRPLRDLTLPNLIIAVQGDDPKAADALRSAHNALTILIQRVTDQNDDNRKLVERSLEHVNAMKKNVLGESVAKSNTYTPQGQRTAGASGSRLISKEA